MIVSVCVRVKYFLYGIANVPCLVLVPLHVQGEMVGAGEAAAAHGALEGFSAGVFAEVARQLVRTGKPPVTPFPCAPVWLLA